MQKGFQEVHLHGCASGMIATPAIGENGNWWIGNDDTGISARGDKGDMGITGPQGSKGETGATGAQGLPGIQGCKGDKGEQGPVGLQGEKGEDGIQGPKGDPGIQGCKGDKGEDGIQGPKGETGATGPQGLQGIQGCKGDKGDQGPVGLPGEKGKDGVQGATGAQGPRGETGATGAQGVQGPKGATGAQGVQGPQGIQGAKGDPGKDADMTVVAKIQDDVEQLSKDILNLNQYFEIPSSWYESGITIYGENRNYYKKTGNELTIFFSLKYTLDVTGDKTIMRLPANIRPIGITHSSATASELGAYRYPCNIVVNGEGLIIMGINTINNPKTNAVFGQITFIIK